MTYNSNHMEGSRLTHDQTRYIFETNTIGVEHESFNVDDIVETTNHFKCIDMVIEQANYMLSEAFIKQLYFTLKNGTKEKTLLDIIDFHVKFERIHPFQDGNDRVGRLIMFKECLRSNIVPFIINDEKKCFIIGVCMSGTPSKAFYTTLALQHRMLSKNTWIILR